MSSEVAALVMKTPVGRLWIVARRRKIWAAELEPRWEQLAYSVHRILGDELREGQVVQAKLPALERARRAIERYFDGNLVAPTRVELDLEGSELQQRVWRAVRSIPAGKTWSYGQLATRVRKSGAFRAVGAANGANRCAIFVPCHRVVGSLGDLRGYGAGLEVKSRLLEHEGVANDGARIGRAKDI